MAEYPTTDLRGLMSVTMHTHGANDAQKPQAVALCQRQDECDALRSLPVLLSNCRDQASLASKSTPGQVDNISLDTVAHECIRASSLGVECYCATRSNDAGILGAPLVIDLHASSHAEVHIDVGASGAGHEGCPQAPSVPRMSPFLPTHVPTLKSAIGMLSAADYGIKSVDEEIEHIQALVRERDGRQGTATASAGSASAAGGVVSFDHAAEHLLSDPALLERVTALTRRLLSDPAMVSVFATLDPAIGKAISDGALGRASALLTAGLPLDFQGTSMSRTSHGEEAFKTVAEGGSNSSGGTPTGHAGDKSDFGSSLARGLARQSARSKDGPTGSMISPSQGGARGPIPRSEPVCAPSAAPTVALQSSITSSIVSSLSGRMQELCPCPACASKNRNFKGKDGPVFSGTGVLREEDGFMDDDGGSVSDQGYDEGCEDGRGTASEGEEDVEQLPASRDSTPLDDAADAALEDVPGPVAAGASRSSSQYPAISCNCEVCTSQRRKAKERKERGKGFGSSGILTETGQSASTDSQAAGGAAGGWATEAAPNPSSSSEVLIMNWALSGDSASILRHLNSIKKEGAASIRQIVDRQHDDEGDTPLIAAARKGHLNTVTVLLDAGAAVAIENDFGRTALHVAAVSGHVEVILLLVRRGSDIFARDRNECTPLCRAVVNGQKAAAVALAIKGGMSPYVNIASPAGDTPLSRACVLKNWDMATLLVWGCKANLGTMSRSHQAQLRLQMKLLQRRQEDIMPACALLVREMRALVEHLDAGRTLPDHERVKAAVRFIGPGGIPGTAAAVENAGGILPLLKTAAEVKRMTYAPQWAAAQAAAQQAPPVYPSSPSVSYNGGGAAAGLQPAPPSPPASQKPAPAARAQHPVAAVAAPTLSGTAHPLSLSSTASAGSRGTLTSGDGLQQPVQLAPSLERLLRLPGNSATAARVTVHELYAAALQLSRMVAGPRSVSGTSSTSSVLKVVPVTTATDGPDQSNVEVGDLEYALESLESAYKGVQDVEAGVADRAGAFVNKNGLWQAKDDPSECGAKSDRPGQASLEDDTLPGMTLEMYSSSALMSKLDAMLVSATDMANTMSRLEAHVVEVSGPMAATEEKIKLGTAQAEDHAAAEHARRMADIIMDCVGHMKVALSAATVISEIAKGTFLCKLAEVEEARVQRSSASPQARLSPPVSTNAVTLLSDTVPALLIPLPVPTPQAVGNDDGWRRILPRGLLNEDMWRHVLHGTPLPSLASLQDSQSSTSKGPTGGGGDRTGDPTAFTGKRYGHDEEEGEEGREADADGDGGAGAGAVGNSRGMREQEAPVRVQVARSVRVGAPTPTLVPSEMPAHWGIGAAGADRDEFLHAVGQGKASDKRVDGLLSSRSAGQVSVQVPAASGISAAQSVDEDMEELGLSIKSAVQGGTGRGKGRKESKRDVKAKALAALASGPIESIPIPTKAPVLAPVRVVHEPTFAPSQKVVAEARASVNSAPTVVKEALETQPPTAVGQSHFKAQQMKVPPTAAAAQKLVSRLGASVSVVAPAIPMRLPDPPKVRAVGEAPAAMSKLGSLASPAVLVALKPLDKKSDDDGVLHVAKKKGPAEKTVPQEAKRAPAPAPPMEVILSSTAKGAVKPGTGCGPTPAPLVSSKQSALPGGGVSLPAALSHKVLIIDDKAARSNGKATNKATAEAKDSPSPRLAATASSLAPGTQTGRASPIEHSSTQSTAWASVAKGSQAGASAPNNGTVASRAHALVGAPVAAPSSMGPGLGPGLTTLHMSPVPATTVQGHSHANQLDPSVAPLRGSTVDPSNLLAFQAQTGPNLELSNILGGLGGLLGGLDGLDLGNLSLDFGVGSSIAGDSGFNTSLPLASVGPVSTGQGGGLPQGLPALHGFGSLSLSGFDRLDNLASLGSFDTLGSLGAMNSMLGQGGTLPGGQHAQSQGHGSFGAHTTSYGHTFPHSHSATAAQGQGHISSLWGSSQNMGMGMGFGMGAYLVPSNVQLTGGGGGGTAPAGMPSALARPLNPLYGQSQVQGTASLSAASQQAFVSSLDGFGSDLSTGLAGFADMSSLLMYGNGIVPPRAPMHMGMGPGPASAFPSAQGYAQGVQHVVPGMQGYGNAHPGTGDVRPRVALPVYRDTRGPGQVDAGASAATGQFGTGLLGHDRSSFW